MELVVMLWLEIVLFLKKGRCDKSAYLDIWMIVIYFDYYVWVLMK